MSKPLDLVKLRPALLKHHEEMLHDLNRLKEFVDHFESLLKTNIATLKNEDVELDEERVKRAAIHINDMSGASYHRGAKLAHTMRQITMVVPSIHWTIAKRNWARFFGRKEKKVNNEEEGN